MLQKAGVEPPLGYRRKAHIYTFSERSWLLQNLVQDLVGGYYHPTWAC